MSEKGNPLVGRAAELHEYATNDLPVEENLASGASVDDLVAAGVLYDDYDPDNDPAYSFTPKPTAEEMAKLEIEASKALPMSDEEFQVLLRKSTKYGRMGAEYRKKANRRETWT